MLKNFAALCVLGFGALGVAHATPLALGQTVAAAPLSFAGPQIGYYNQNGVDNGTFIGNYRVQVFQDPNNLFCSGCLDFVFAVANVGKGGLMTDLTAGFFNAPYKTNVGYAGGQGIAPTTVSRSAGGLIDFNFAGANAIMPGQYSMELVVQTDAINFNAGIIRTGIGMGGTDIPSFEPTSTPTPTPEPGTLVLLGTGLVGLAGAARMRFGL